jgi:internalin A
MPKLSALWVFEDPALRDLSPLSCSTSLDHLLLGNVGQVHLAPLADVVDLRSLYIDDTRGMDLSPLRECLRIKRLLLGRLDDISVLQTSLAPTALSFLIIGHCSTLRDVRMLRRFEQLGRLRALHLNSCPVAGLAGIEWWADTLASLSLRGASALWDLRPLRALTRLNSLDISETSVSDLAPLRDLPNLTALHLRDFPALPDLTPLVDLPELRYLCLSGSGEVDLTPLEGKPRLELHLARRQKVRGAELLGEGSKILRDW